MLKEVLMVKVLKTCKKLLNIEDNTVIYQLRDCIKIKCINFFTQKDYTEEFLTFIRTEQKTSNVMTSARIQPFCRKYNINISCFDGARIIPRNITQRETALKMHNNQYCLNGKSIRISFHKVIEDELKPKFKVVDNFICDKHV